jgi:hypothetical protein
VLAAWLLRSAPALRRPTIRKPAPAGPSGPPATASKTVDDMLRDLKKQGF